MDIPVEYLANIIFGCFVLHNYCERRKCEQVTLEERKYNPQIDKSSSYNTPLGKRVRETIADYFKEYLYIYCCKKLKFYCMIYCALNHTGIDYKVTFDKSKIKV